MLLFGSTSTIWSVICPIGGKLPTRSKSISLAYTSVATGKQIAAAIAAVATTALVLSAGKGEVAGPQQQEETLSNIPQTLSSECTAEPKDCKRRYKIQRPKSRKAESCTSKCTTVCMQGGFGSPGEGPFSIRRPLVVFKDGFRSRKYCRCSSSFNTIHVMGLNFIKLPKNCCK
ncbi:uncharacterized protein LOC142530082 isoform X1 [Primulina tabacum]|uniref:uncharacterized protein LOC142530082 isoform X1 n=1 Tax=Primulina tabacum TaxID=48773 RepID=UPI003F5A0B4E